VAQGVRRMTTLPLWLQITGILMAGLGSIAGVTGAVLGIRSEMRRRREAEPDVMVRWEEQQYSDDTRRSWIVLTNQGHVAVTIVDAFLKIMDSSEVETMSRRGTSGIHRELPLRLEPRDQKIIHTTPHFMFALLEPGEYVVVVTMVDGVGNHYDSAPFAVVQPGPQ
jgi:hypothetical protein